MLKLVINNTDKFYYRIVKILKILTRSVVKVHVQGLQNVPAEGGFIIAPNHVSHLDPIILGTILSKNRPVRALAKASLFSLPIVGKVLIKMGHIPVHRNSREAKNSLASAEQQLLNKQVIGIYPEGTINMTKNIVGEFKTGVARLSLATNCQILPVAQKGAEKAFPPGRKTAVLSLFKAVFSKPNHYVLVGEPIRPNKDETVAELTIRLKTVITQMVKELPNYSSGK